MDTISWTGIFYLFFVLFFGHLCCSWIFFCKIVDHSNCLELPVSLWLSVDLEFIKGITRWKWPDKMPAGDTSQIALSRRVAPWQSVHQVGRRRPLTGKCSVDTFLDEYFWPLVPHWGILSELSAREKSLEGSLIARLSANAEADYKWSGRKSTEHYSREESQFRDCLPGWSSSPCHWRNVSLSTFNLLKMTLIDATCQELPSNLRGPSADVQLLKVSQSKGGGGWLLGERSYIKRWRDWLGYL